MASEGLNKCMLIGNLGADPELKHTQSGKALLRMRIATTERYGEEGQRKESTEWHTAIMWGKRAEALSRFLSKGETVYLEGRLQTRSWEGQDGSKRYSTEVVATDIRLLGSRGGGSRNGGAQRGGQRRGGQRDDFPPDDFDDMDLPF